MTTKYMLEAVAAADAEIDHYSVRARYDKRDNNPNGQEWRRNKHVRLMISVGKEYHEGKKIEALVEWINNNPQIEKVYISVNDLLQRHNLMAMKNLLEEEASAEAIEEGDEWINRNRKALDKIRCTKIYTQWQERLDTPEFTETHKALLAYYDENPEFQEAVATDALSLERRRKDRRENVPDSFIGHSIDYLLEEMAVFAMQTAKNLFALEVYPGSNLEAAKHFLRLDPARRDMLPERLKGLADRSFLRINFEPKAHAAALKQIPVRVLNAA